MKILLLTALSCLMMYNPIICMDTKKMALEWQDTDECILSGQIGPQDKRFCEVRKRLAEPAIIKKSTSEAKTPVTTATAPQTNSAVNTQTSTSQPTQKGSLLHRWSSYLFPQNRYKQTITPQPTPNIQATPAAQPIDASNATRPGSYTLSDGDVGFRLAGNHSLSDLTSTENIQNTYLVSGPPGIGKSQNIEIIAAEADCHIGTINASKIVKKYVGTGSIAIDAAFDEALYLIAETNTKVVLAVEEINAFAAPSGTENDEYYKTATTFWRRLDENKNNPNLIVIATSNQPDDLCDVLAGRFKQHIKMTNPKEEDREKLISQFSKNNNIPCTPEDQKILVKSTDGFSTRALKTIFQGAKLHPDKQGITAVIDLMHIERHRLEKTRKDTPENVKLSEGLNRRLIMLKALFPFDGYLFSFETEETKMNGNIIVENPRDNNFLIYSQDNTVRQITKEEFKKSGRTHFGLTHTEASKNVVQANGINDLAKTFGVRI